MMSWCAAVPWSPPGPYRSAGFFRARDSKEKPLCVPWVASSCSWRTRAATRRAREKRDRDVRMLLTRAAANGGKYFPPNAPFSEEKSGASTRCGSGWGRGIFSGKNTPRMGVFLRGFHRIPHSQFGDASSINVLSPGYNATTEDAVRHIVLLSASDNTGGIMESEGKRSAGVLPAAKQDLWQVGRVILHAPFPPHPQPLRRRINAPYRRRVLA